MNAKELEKIMPSSAKKQPKVQLTDYLKTKETCSFTYKFSGQKESHLKVKTQEWNKFRFETEEDKVYITKFDPLVIITNESGWKRLSYQEVEEDE